MSAVVDMVGQKFGRLTVEERAGSNKEGRALWRLVCRCGNNVIGRRSDLISGKIVSCGCRKKERIKHGQNRAHRPTPEYRAWINMVKRCENPKGHEVAIYGERGITVCDRWRHSFEAFFEDMGPRPSSNFSLDRIDNDKGYEPGNCHWATAFEQAANRRYCIRVEYMGETMVLAQALRMAGNPISHSGAKKRLKKGWSFERVISEPKRRCKALATA